MMDDKPLTPREHGQISIIKYKQYTIINPRGQEKYNYFNYYNIIILFLYIIFNKNDSYQILLVILERSDCFNVH